MLAIYEQASLVGTVRLCNINERNRNERAPNLSQSFLRSTASLYSDRGGSNWSLLGSPIETCKLTRSIRRSTSPICTRLANRSSQSFPQACFNAFRGRKDGDFCNQRLAFQPEKEV